MSLPPPPKATAHRDPTAAPLGDAQLCQGGRRSVASEPLESSPPPPVPTPDGLSPGAPPTPGPEHDGGRGRAAGRPWPRQALPSRSLPEPGGDSRGRAHTRARSRAPGGSEVRQQRWAGRGGTEGGTAAASAIPRSLPPSLPAPPQRTTSSPPSHSLPNRARSARPGASPSARMSK